MASSTCAGLQKAEEQKPQDVWLGSGASGSVAQAQPTLSELQSLTAKRVSMSDPTLEVQFVRVFSPLAPQRALPHLSPESILCSSAVPATAHTAQLGDWRGQCGTGRTGAGGHSVSEEWGKEEEKSPSLKAKQKHERIGKWRAKWRRSCFSPADLDTSTPHVNQNSFCRWEPQRTGNKYWELTMFVLRKFFLFQGHFLNYTNLSNVSSVLQEVSFSCIC